MIITKECELSTTPLSDAFQILTIRVQHNFFCIELNNILRVLHLVNLQAIPGSADYMVGLMNLAGKSIPVVDLGMRLGYHNNESYTLETPMIVCTYHDEITAFIVSEIMGIQLISKSDLQLQPMLEGQHLHYSASIALSHGQTFLLDLPSLLNFEESEQK